ncbi:MAG: hypothetical protein LBC09_02450 [Helicobacteraceae bacterium]|jgi:hypothetical protein|nr:hypothetical protein [Helicobacteraceae bacterium]
MNRFIIRNGALALLALLSALVLSGCAATTYYKTEGDPEFSIKKTDRIFVATLDGQTTIEDKSFAALLKAKLRKNGFVVVEENNRASANLMAFFTLDNKTYTGTGSYTTYQTNTTYSSGYIGGTYYSKMLALTAIAGLLITI